MLAGLSVGTTLALLTDTPYEVRLIWVTAASLAGLMAGMLLGPPTEAGHLKLFVDTVQPYGVWPGARPAGTRAALGLAGCWAAVASGTMLLLFVGHQGLFNGWRPERVDRRRRGIGIAIRRHDAAAESLMRGQGILQSDSRLKKA